MSYLLRKGCNMNWFKQREERRLAKDLEQVGVWIEQGSSAYRSGLSPQQSPYALTTREFNWWLCGWTIAWQGDDDE